MSPVVGNVNVISKIKISSTLASHDKCVPYVTSGFTSERLRHGFLFLTIKQINLRVTTLFFCQMGSV